MNTRQPPPRRPWSMTARLIILQLAAVAGLVGAAMITLYFNISSHLVEDNRDELLNQARVISRWLEDSPGHFLESTARDKLLATMPLFIRVIRPDGSIDFASPSPNPPPAAAFPAPGVEPNLWMSPTRTHHLLIAVWLGPTYHPAGSRLQLAYDISDDDALLRHLRQRMSLIYLLTLTLSGLFSYLIARGVFRPVAQLTQAASRIRASDMTARVQEAGWPIELNLLAREFDAMLSRLEESFGRLTRFASDLSHELRTPINNLRGETEVALSRPREPEEYRRVLESGLEECSRLSRLIDTLLFIAKTDNPAQGIRKQNVDAARECQRVAEFFEAMAAERDVMILVRGTGLLLADPELLRRALANLIDNAVRHTPSGGHVDLTVRASATGGTEIEVRDDGSGIPAEHLSRVFERFYRSEKSADQAHATSGFGLGLAIVKSIMDLHGGKVLVESRPGQGTAVTLRFPDPPNT
jgi:two-component system, OmpR family, heavy metal sensor histidine kinase CusS